MTHEEKQLLLEDLCARLPYGVKVKCGREILTLNVNWLQMFQYHLDEIKPYLRPMSSITEEEEKEFEELFIGYSISRDRNCVYHSTRGDLSLGIIDWLNANGFDYRGLIPMGLALEAKEEMYK